MLVEFGQILRSVGANCLPVHLILGYDLVVFYPNVTVPHSSLMLLCAVNILQTGKLQRSDAKFLSPGYVVSK